MSQDFLTPIIERKRREVPRRKRHRLAALPSSAADDTRNQLALRALRRAPQAPPSVIAEFKRKSPSAGVIRAPVRGDAAQIATAYARAGASAVSVLCDGPGFLGSPLDLRRAALAAGVPVLFKEFVIDEVQVQLARALGAHMVLLIVRVLTPAELSRLVDATLALGMAPVVEAADEREVMIAQTTRADIIGVNARDLGTFRVDVSAAQQCLDRIERSRIAVHMSGIRTREDFAAIAKSRADAVLIGEGLMRAADPGSQLRTLLGD